jgi:soluble lytic murein transglycosylase-like protein
MVHSDGTVEYTNRYDTPRRGYSPAQGTASLSKKYDRLIEEIAGREGVDPVLVKCIVKAESDFNPNAVSVAGAMGLMQIMQVIAEHYNVSDPFDPEENLSAGTKHFAFLMRYFGNDIPLALAAYHAGLGRVRRNMAVPPIQSTVRYVNSIMNRYTGKSDREYGGAVKKLYMKIRKDGTILISN